MNTQELLGLSPRLFDGYITPSGVFNLRSKKEDSVIDLLVFPYMKALLAHGLKMHFNNKIHFKLTMGSHAYYDSIQDHIGVTHSNEYANDNQYYLVIFHELTHWTGHSSRLERNLTLAALSRGGREFEEMVAIFGSSILLDQFELQTAETFEENKRCLEHYCNQIMSLRGLEGHTEVLLSALEKANEAVEYLNKLGGYKNDEANSTNG